MNAFDKLKIKHMPANYKVISDTTTGLYLTYYSTWLENCLWGNILEAIHFSTQEQADAAIISWGETPGAKFIGHNPPLH